MQLLFLMEQTPMTVNAIVMIVSQVISHCLKRMELESSIANVMMDS